MARAGIETPGRGGVGSGSMRSSLRSATAESGFLRTGSRLRRACGGSSITADKMALSAPGSRDPGALHMCRAVIASTLAASPAPPVRAILLRLVPAILARCGPQRRRRTSTTTTTTVMVCHKLMISVVIKNQLFLGVGLSLVIIIIIVVISIIVWMVLLLWCVVVRPELDPTTASGGVDDIFLRLREEGGGGEEWDDAVVVVFEVGGCGEEEFGVEGYVAGLGGGRPDAGGGSGGGGGAGIEAEREVAGGGGGGDPVCECAGI